MRKSFLGAVGIAAASVLLFAGCAGGGTPTSTGATGGGAKASYKIGISQFVQHPALDAAAEGFQAAFKDAGIDATFDIQNANADQATATSISQKFASSDVDLVLAIATPAAQAAANAIADKPVLFTAVTDPVSAELVKSQEAPGGNVTGTSDMNPVADQIALIQEFLPNAKTVGIIYSSGEVNSEVQVAAAKAAATAKGLTIKEATVTTSADVATAAAGLGQVDAIYIPTDNRVTEGFESVVQYAEANKVPLFGAEVNQVNRGAIATLGLDYYKLGHQTGEMAIKILKDGADPATLAVETQSQFDLVINEQAAAAQGVTIPESVKARAVKPTASATATS